MAKILIVDDDNTLASFLATFLKRSGYEASVAKNAAHARTLMGTFFPDIVLMDLGLPDAHGGELMEELRGLNPSCEFIIITGNGSIRSAVESTKRGAADYLTKPFEAEELHVAVRNILKQQMLTDEVQRLRTLSGTHGSELANGGLPAYQSQSMQETMRLAARAAKQDGIVLLLGESGTGKDHLARVVHAHSARARKPFFCINCAALTPELAESELFGHEPGAFTGTQGRKRGLLELAQDGTLLLNEIGELSPNLQSKLLTFLDTFTFFRVGGVRPISINARIFAATNRDLEAEVERGTFRRDLFYRINVFPITVPPLRERREDIPLIAEALLDQLVGDMALRRQTRLSPSSLKLIRAYHWPGNVRELRNVLERALMLADGTVLETHHFNVKTCPAPAELERAARSATCALGEGKDFHSILDSVARDLLQEAIQSTRTKQEAAQLLGLSRHALAHQLKAHHVEPTEPGNDEKN